MLRSKNLTNVLSQAVQENKQGSTVVSSILTTTSGRLVASFHNSRVPPTPHTCHDEDDKEAPYNVDRSMKTKVYSLFASSVWGMYSKANWESDGTRWVSALTDDALLVVHNVTLAGSGQNLLLVVVADPSTALGLVQKKASETASVLEEGLSDFKVYD